MTAPDPRRGLPSCSALNRLANCPASHRLGKQAEAAGVAPQSGPEADSGTRIHRYLETEADEDWETLTHDERETAAICLSMRDRLIEEWNPGGVTLAEYKEQRLGLTRLGNVCPSDGNDDADFIVTGMADLVLVDRRGMRGLVIDWKTGRGDVDDAADNDQLRGLAVLAAGQYKLQHVRVAIIQPLAGAPTVADYDAALIEEAQIWLEMVCEETGNDHEPRAGDHCQYCPARAVCPTLREEATDLPVYLVSSAETDAAPIVARALDLPADRLGRLLAGRRIIKYYLHALEAAAKMRIERGEAIPGWELRDKNGRRKITDTDAASVALAPLLASAEGGAQAALLRCAELRPKALQDEIQIASGKKSKTRYNMTQTDAKKHLANALGDLLAVPSHKELVETGAALEGGDDE